MAAQVAALRRELKGLRRQHTNERLEWSAKVVYAHLAHTAPLSLPLRHPIFDTPHPTVHTTPHTPTCSDLPPVPRTLEQIAGLQRELAGAVTPRRAGLAEDADARGEGGVAQAELAEHVGWRGRARRAASSRLGGLWGRIRRR